MIGPDGLFEEWIAPGTQMAPRGVLAARVALLVMLGGAIAVLLLLRWLVHVQRRRDTAAMRRMQHVLMAAIWLGFIVGLGGYFWYCYSLLPRR